MKYKHQIMEEIKKKDEETPLPKTILEEIEIRLRNDTKWNKK